MNNKQSIDDEKFEEALRLLPWYAIGWLSPEERNLVKEALLEFPQLQESLETEQEIIHLVKNDKSLLNGTLLEPTEERLEKVLSMIDQQPSNTFTDNESLSAKLNNVLSSILFGGTNKTQYAVIAVVSTLSIALLFAFIAPLMKQQSNVFHPATIETPVNKHAKDITILLVGLNTAPSDPNLLKILQESHARINAVPGKDGMYRISLPKKLDPIQTENLIKKFSAHKSLFWFAGEDY